MEIILLIFLGIVSYFIVKQSVANITKTPIWLLWLVLMTPPLLLTAWMLVLGKAHPLPLPLLVIPFVLCPFLYWWLIQKGRPTPPPEEKTPSPETKSPRSPIANTPRPLTPDEEKSLRKCFPWGVYYLQAVDYRPQAILCRGRLKSNADRAYETVRDNVEAKFGDRFLLIFHEGAANKPFFALVPNPRARGREISTREVPLEQPRLVLSLFVITLFTTTYAGAIFAGVPQEQLHANPALFRQGLPYSLALLAVLGVHEFGHYGAAIYYRIRTTLPYFIPIPFFLGTLGAFSQKRSPVPNRRALFDIAFAGSISGFLVTLPLLIWGLSLSEVVELSEQSNLFQFTALDPRFSFFLAVSGKLALGESLGAGMGINLHPLAIAGYLGVIVTALNLMPVGQLDGGHIVHAMFGQRAAAAIGQVARLLMLLFAFARSEFIIWAILLLFMPNTDEPALNDVTDLDNKRDFLGLCALALLVFILLPLPGKLANVLGV
ncbi:MAG: site-2 protease family protein [Cyanobacteria bacterium SBLK]|nr:site-2 protease family protein [Cyanobacteria bacterium SBLK]